MTRFRIILIIIIVFVVLPLVAFVLYLLFWKPSEPVQPVSYIDKDTQEVVEEFPGVSAETDGNTAVTLLGLTQLNEDVPKPHFNYIKDTISAFSSDNLGDRYAIIALLPDSYINNDGSITATLRLGEDGNQTIPLQITSSRFTGDLQVIIGSADTEGGVYDSGVIEFQAD